MNKFAAILVLSTLVITPAIAQVGNTVNPPGAGFSPLLPPPIVETVTVIETQVDGTLIKAEGKTETHNLCIALTATFASAVRPGEPFKRPPKGDTWEGRSTGASVEKEDGNMWKENKALLKPIAEKQLAAACPCSKGFVPSSATVARYGTNCKPKIEGHGYYAMTLKDNGATIIIDPENARRRTVAAGTCTCVESKPLVSVETPAPEVTAVATSVPTVAVPALTAIPLAVR